MLEAFKRGSRYYCCKSKLLRDKSNRDRYLRSSLALVTLTDMRNVETPKDPTVSLCSHGACHGPRQETVLVRLMWTKVTSPTFQLH